MSALLRRRGQLDPLDSSRDLQNEHSSDDDPFVITYSSPCKIRVSNDPAKGPRPTSKPNPCNITFYDCFDSDTENWSEDRVIFVDYDYELHYTKGANLEQTLFGLEASMLEHLASATGLVECPVFSSARRTKSRSMEEFGLPDFFGAVSSELVDTIDEDNEECIVPVSSSVSSIANCRPMKGSMTAFVRDDVELSPNFYSVMQSSIQRFVRAGMNSDIYLTGNVQKVSFIGTRSNATEQSSTPPEVMSIGEETDSGEKGLGAGGIAMLAVGAFSILFIMLALVFRNKRRQDRLEKHVRLEEGDLVYNDELRVSRNGNNVQSAFEVNPVEGSMADRDSLALKPNGTTETDNGSDGSTSDSDKSETNPDPDAEGAPDKKMEANWSPKRAKEFESFLQIEEVGQNTLENKILIRKSPRRKRRASNGDSSPSLASIVESDLEDEDNDETISDISVLQSIESVQTGSVSEAMEAAGCFVNDRTNTPSFLLPKQETESWFEYHERTKQII